MKRYFFRPSNEQRQALRHRRIEANLTQVALAKMAKVQPQVITALEIMAPEGEMGRGLHLDKANQVYRTMGLTEVTEDDPSCHYIGEFTYPTKTTDRAPSRVVRFQYRCRRCRELFESGRYILEDRALQRLKTLIKYYESTQTDQIHVCTDGGHGFADIVGFGPVIILGTGPAQD